jgi:hypothetical protein
MDESQLDVITLQVDLTDAGADRAPALGERVTEALAMKCLSGCRRDRGDDVAQLENDVAQFG